MPATSTTGSANISILDSNVMASLCDGVFKVDAKRSVYIGLGAANVLGAKVQILLQLGSDTIPVKEFGSGYDIEPPMSSEVVVSIPTKAGTFQYGTYKVTLRLYDTLDKYYDVVKTVKICPPNNANKTKKYGIVAAQIKGICKGNPALVHFLINNLPAYNGFLSSSQVNDLTLEFPTGSEQLPKSITGTNFTDLLFEGEYKLHGDICGTYEYGDGVRVEVPYKVNSTKNVKCSIDRCCVLTKLKELNDNLSEECSDSEKASLSAITLDALLLLTSTELAIECGEDASEYIDRLEALLGCKCTCDCDPAAPFNGGGIPAENVRIEGCNIEESQDGLTTVYTFTHRSYILEVTPNDNILTASPVDDSVDCERKQVLTFDISAAYTKIKQLMNETLDEANFFASIINKSINSVDPTCIGYSGVTWPLLTYAQKWAAIMAKFCECCSCTGVVEQIGIEPDGNDGLITPVFSGDVSWWRIYIDGYLVAELSAGYEDYLAKDIADGNDHNVLVMAIGSNHRVCSELSKSFIAYGCPDIEGVNMASNVTHEVACPFDLNTLIGGAPMPPLGTTVVWYWNSKDPANVLADPSAVYEGDYWAYNVDANGCHSIGKKVTIRCNSNVGVTAPQQLQVIPLTGGGYVVRFASAMKPPPDNSYTVMRRLASDPDELASYTILDTPQFNSSIQRWQSPDTGALQNTLYVYRVVSNGGDDPYIEIEYADIPCPAIEFEPTEDSIGFTFVPNGGDVTKIIIELWNAAKTVKLHSIGYNEPFVNPTVDEFDDTYVNPSTTYNVRLVIYIGTYEHICDFTAVTSDPAAEVQSGLFSLGVEPMDMCAQPTLTLYYTGATPPVAGTAMYTNSSLTSLVDIDYTRILIVDTGKIHEITAGVIGLEIGECL